MLLGTGSVAVVYERIQVPDPNAAFAAQTTRVFYADGKTELGTFATQNRESIPYEAMPRDIKDAVVAAENRSFWTDPGIDARGLARALVNNLAGGPTQGASTITQQYVKVLHLSQERSLNRKAREAVLSIKLRREMTKEAVLAGYLNTVYFGRGAYGVEAAARAFFACAAPDLTLSQSALLASVINNPSGLSPTGGPAALARLRARYRYVLDSMVETGSITSEEARRAQRKLPGIAARRPGNQYGGQRGHMLQLVRGELLRLGYSEERIDGDGLRITATFDPANMVAALEAASAVRGRADADLHVAIADVESGTGALRAFFAGQDYLVSEINWAVAGGRAGSALAPLAIPATAGGFGMREEDVGPSRLDPGEVVELLSGLGIPGQTDRGFGIPTTSPGLVADQHITDGAARISPINLANAYATVASYGMAAPVHVIDRIVDRHGTALYRAPRARQALAADQAIRTRAAIPLLAGTAGAPAGDSDGPAVGWTGRALNGARETSSSWSVAVAGARASAALVTYGDGETGLPPHARSASRELLRTYLDRRGREPAGRGRGRGRLRLLSATSTHGSSGRSKPAPATAKRTRPARHRCPRDDAATLAFRRRTGGWGGTAELRSSARCGRAWVRYADPTIPNCGTVAVQLQVDAVADRGRRRAGEERSHVPSCGFYTRGLRAGTGDRARIRVGSRSCSPRSCWHTWGAWSPWLTIP
ncbi:MAG: transglycosylase domain-containing protein [Nocardioides sp.]